MQDPDDLMKNLHLFQSPEELICIPEYLQSDVQFRLNSIFKELHRQVLWYLKEVSDVRFR